MSRKDCGHTDLINRIAKEIIDGKNPQPSLKDTTYCTQCQDWVEFNPVKNKAIDKIKRDKERFEELHKGK